MLHRSPTGGGAGRGGRADRSEPFFGAAFPDTSVPMGGWRLSGMPFAEIGITGATLRTVMSRCGELERTSRGCYRAQTRRANADAV